MAVTDNFASLAKQWVLFSMQGHEDVRRGCYWSINSIGNGLDTMEVNRRIA